mmetsp:Transcript_19855/g.35777  ORF Transcript_19855/g.35777 Transcript_19855/m.35777 type:complete len:258 (-) Transcript_19855:126-899(-)
MAIVTTARKSFGKSLGKLLKNLVEETSGFSTGTSPIAKGSSSRKYNFRGISTDKFQVRTAEGIPFWFAIYSINSVNSGNKVNPPSRPSHFSRRPSSLPSSPSLRSTVYDIPLIRSEFPGIRDTGALGPWPIDDLDPRIRKPRSPGMAGKTGMGNGNVMDGSGISLCFSLLSLSAPFFGSLFPRSNSDSPSSSYALRIRKMGFSIHVIMDFKNRRSCTTCSYSGLKILVLDLGSCRTASRWSPAPPAPAEESPPGATK